MKVEFAQQLYQEEWSRRDQIADNLGPTLTVLIALVGAVGLMAKSIEFDSSWTSRAFAFFLANSVLLLVTTAYFLARSFHGYVYQQIPSPAELNEFHLQLKAYHLKLGDPPAVADLTFDSYLVDRYVQAAEKNSCNNASKAEYLFRARQSLILTLVLTAFLVGPWAAQSVGRAPLATHVVVDAPVGLYAPGGRTMRAQTEPTTKQPQAPKPEKPVGPPNRLIKEGEQPKPRPSPASPNK